MLSLISATKNGIYFVFSYAVRKSSFVGKSKAGVNSHVKPIPFSNETPPQKPHLLLSDANSKYLSTILRNGI
jgi:hypothetical protein